MNYIIADPTKNITVLVTEPVKKEDYATVAKEMFAAVPTCEQVGFFVEPNHLEMAAGEFCGNATLSAAAYYAHKHGITDGTVSMTCSGVDGEIPVKIKAHTFKSSDSLDGCADANARMAMRRNESVRPSEEYTYTGTLAMPYPQQTATLDSHPVIYLPGIAHMIMPADRFTKRQVENNIRDYADRAALALAQLQANDGAIQSQPAPLQAFGILLWDEAASYMRPCVYCRDIDTVVWEHGCATGSTCIGYYRATQRRCDTITPVNQPGGTITVKCDPASRTINLTGSVTLCIDT